MWSWRRSLEYCYIQEINIGSTPWLLSWGKRAMQVTGLCRSWINLCLISLLLTDRANWTSVVSFLFVWLGHWPFFPFFFFFVWYFQAVIFMLDWKRYQAYSSLVDVFWHLAEKEKKVWWYGLYFTHRWPERRGLHETCNVPMTWFRSPPKIYSFRRNKVIAHQALHTN